MAGSTGEEPRQKRVFFPLHVTKDSLILLLLEGSILSLITATVSLICDKYYVGVRNKL